MYGGLTLNRCKHGGPRVEPGETFIEDVLLFILSILVQRRFIPNVPTFALNLNMAHILLRRQHVVLVGDDGRRPVPGVPFRGVDHEGGEALPGDGGEEAGPLAVLAEDVYLLPPLADEGDGLDGDVAPPAVPQDGLGAGVVLEGEAHGAGAGEDEAHEEVERGRRRRGADGGVVHDFDGGGEVGVGEGAEEDGGCGGEEVGRGVGG